MANSKKVSKKAPKKSASPDSLSKLDKASELIRKMLGSDDEDSIVNIDPEQFKESHPYIPTTSIILDQLISGRPNSRGISPCPGWPKGKFIQLYGMESSGKTTTALHMSKSVTSMGGSVGYIDFEQDIVPDYAQKLGVPIDDPKRFRLFQPKCFEEGAMIMWTLAHAGIELIIVDSIPAAVPRAFLEKSVKEIGDKGQIGVNAAQWAAFLPRLRPVCRKFGVTLLGISQIRASISQYGPPETVPGGNAWKFYSSLRVRLQKKKALEAAVYSPITNQAEEKQVGIWVQAKLDKCKISAQQGAEALFCIRFGEGIDNLTSIMEIAQAHKIIRKDGSWFTWVTPSGEEVRFQGVEKLRVHIKSDPVRVSALEKQVRPHLASAMVGAAPDVEDGEGEEDEEDEEGDDPDAGLAAALADVESATTSQIQEESTRTRGVGARILSKLKEGDFGLEES